MLVHESQYQYEVMRVFNIKVQDICEHWTSGGNDGSLPFIPGNREQHSTLPIRRKHLAGPECQGAVHSHVRTSAI